MRCFVIILLFISATCFSQSKTPLADLHFSHLTTKDGLSTNLTRSVFQDERGMIWICTTDAGLDRYDGNVVKNFRYSINDTNSLPGNNLSYMTEDPQHKFWIATNAGLYFFDPIMEKGKRIALNKENSITDILHVKCDSKGFVFVNTNENIYEINSKTGAIVQYAYSLEENNPLLLQKKNIVTCLIFLKIVKINYG